MKDYHHHGGSAYVTDEGVDLELSRINDTSGDEEVTQEEGQSVKLTSVKEGDEVQSKDKDNRKSGLSLTESGARGNLVHCDRCLESRAILYHVTYIVSRD